MIRSVPPSSGQPTLQGRLWSKDIAEICPGGKQISMGEVGSGAKHSPGSDHNAKNNMNQNVHFQSLPKS